MTKKKYRDPERERKRIATIKARKGDDWLKRNAIKAGKLTPTKFNSETASKAANIRWAKVRAERARKEHPNGNSN